MSQRLTPAFDMTVRQVPIERIFPTKTVLADETKNSVFRRILSSIRELRLIEPLVVYPHTAGTGTNYSLLDGHTRLEVLRQLAHKTVPCLISTEDEAYTYNHKVNVVPPIQEHFMIMKAIDHGVSEERIATALDLDVTSIRQKRDLLNGICPEAVELLKTKHICRDALLVFRKVKPMRQMEMAELMIRGYNFTASYAKCLLAATSDEQLVDPQKPKLPRGIKADDLAGMEREMETLEQNFLALEETHGTTTLHLVLATGYLRKLLDNAAVVRFLSKKYADILSEFRKLIEANSLEAAGG